MPAALELQETVATPDPVMLLGLMAPQLRPDGIVSLRLTIPAKLLSEVIVIVDVTEAPAKTAAGLVAVKV